MGVLAATGSSADPAHPLFSQVTANPPIGVAIPKDPYAKATWYGRRQTYPEPEGLKDLDSLTLNLAPRVQLLAHQERATEPNPGHEFWVGSIDGDPGSRVEIVRVGGSIAGSIRSPLQGSFQIQPAPQGWHRIVQLPEQDGPDCATSSPGT
ncbi:MAG TPA: hypothetical protein DCM86_11480, partial [Verrucomicrobiales bacterium]|nr:hypothetical protein [Verrucomicrobiales bacterium]